MRPIQKPATTKTVTDYHQWKSDLEEAIGMFCTYCGMRLNNSPQVEHVVPVNPKTGNAQGNPLEWNNVVFSCAPCNGASGKGNKNYNSKDHYMPEAHNTLLPFIYPQAAVPEHITVDVAAELSPRQKEKAQKTISVFNFKNTDTRANRFDYRSSERWQAAQQAVEANFSMYEALKSSPAFNATAVAEKVAIQAVSIGFFQLWIGTFINEPEVLKELVRVFPGTHQQSFDSKTGKPIPRNPSNSNDSI